MAIDMFSQKLAMQFLDSKEAFPIDLDDAWAWIGYAAKKNAKDTLLSQFEKGTDFVYSAPKVSTGGRPRQSIMITAECFKALSLVAQIKEKRAVQKGYVYCIYSHEAKCCKIGYSENPLERLKGLQTGFPYELSLGWKVKGTLLTERALHQRFKAHSLRGEWFDICVLSHLLAMKTCTSERRSRNSNSAVL